MSNKKPTKNVKKQLKGDDGATPTRTVNPKGSSVGEEELKVNSELLSKMSKKVFYTGKRAKWAIAVQNEHAVIFAVGKSGFVPRNRYCYLPLQALQQLLQNGQALLKWIQQCPATKESIEIEKIKALVNFIRQNPMYKELFANYLKGE